MVEKFTVQITEAREPYAWRAVPDLTGVRMTVAIGAFKLFRNIEHLTNLRLRVVSEASGKAVNMSGLAGRE